MQDKILNLKLLDEYCTLQEVNIIENNNLKFTCTLNKTNVKTNENKFYIMQLLKTITDTILYVRYGRVGEKGTITTKYFSSEELGKSEFKKIFKTKTGNTFGMDFYEHDGKYSITQITYNLSPVQNQNQFMPSKLQQEPSLETVHYGKIKYLMELICDKKMIMNELNKLNFNTKNYPFHKISLSHIEKAMNITQTIANKMNNMDPEINYPSYEHLSSQYLTLIPHSFGKHKPIIINNAELLRVQNKILNYLNDMIVITNLIGDLNIETIYEKLNAKIIPVDENTMEWKMINNYINNTHGDEYNKYIKVEEIYEIIREEEKNNFVNYGNNVLLFYGSTLSKYCSILQKGLILNPQVSSFPTQDKMFGNGFYFTNFAAKAVMQTGTYEKGKRVIMLCDVSLGNQYKSTPNEVEITKEFFLDKEYQSVWSQGVNTVCMSNLSQIDNCNIPIEKFNESGIESNSYYDEFIVYNTNQFYIKYLIVLSLP